MSVISVIRVILGCVDAHGTRRVPGKAIHDLLLLYSPSKSIPAGGGSVGRVITSTRNSFSFKFLFEDVDLSCLTGIKSLLFLLLT